MKSINLFALLILIIVLIPLVSSHLNAEENGYIKEELTQAEIASLRNGNNLFFSGLLITLLIILFVYIVKIILRGKSKSRNKKKSK